MRAFYAWLLIAPLIAACAAPPPQTAEQSTFSDAYWTALMDRAGDYAKSGGTKSLYACIRWPDASGQKFGVGGFGGVRTSDSSDGQIPVQRLREGAQRSCKQHESKGCTCHEVDRDGRNVLIVPEGVTGLPEI